jgi:hypothetical protein
LCARHEHMYKFGQTRHFLPEESTDNVRFKKLQIATEHALRKERVLSAGLSVRIQSDGFATELTLIKPHVYLRL